MTDSSVTIDWSAVVDCQQVYGEWTGERAEAVRAGAEALDAELTDDGRYRYYADETSTDYLVDDDAVAELGAALLSGHSMSEAYSIWSSGTDAEEG